jgi:uncharacterized protein YyaL (SSP411 family)
MPNRLAGETSPYLLQHKDNPVDWYPWGDVAFEKARVEDRPVFLSVGYSACHWCHVMAHESFEDEQTAAIMNEHFVCVKVDREERPDVDSIYMNAVQALTGAGGWPMSVWLLPDGRPFYGGTYFPAVARQGMPSFKQVLLRVAEVYEQHRDQLEDDAQRLTEAISGRVNLDSGQAGEPAEQTLQLAFQSLAQRYDAQWGGFGARPKFPPGMALDLLLRLHHRYAWPEALKMVTHTLDRMTWGGIYDQIGGGFHRYSTDTMWLVPHFEKMLYDNAQLIGVYLHAYQVTGERRYRQVVEDTAAYVAREMTAPSGGFYSSQDADSEGEEGKFFIWQADKLHEALGSVASVEAVLDYWGVLRGPNFEEQSILWVPEPPDVVAGRHAVSVGALLGEVRTARDILFELREGRVRPSRDDKVLTAWNGLMIDSLAQAGRVLGRDDLTQMAAHAADFILGEMRAEDRRLRRSYKDGRARFDAYLEDYALLAQALLELYQTTFDLRWYRESLALAETMVDQFWDDRSGFYDTARDHESLITRPQEVTDNATPSGTSGAVGVLLRHAILAERPAWREMAMRVLVHFDGAMQQYPQAFGYLAAQLDFALGHPHEIAVVGDPTAADTRALLDVIWQPYRPNQVVALRAPRDDSAAQIIPLLEGRDLLDGHATAYVCRSYVCRLPVGAPDALAVELERPAGA